MSHRIDVAAINMSVREFIHDLGVLREPVELVVEGAVVAKLIAPMEMSDAEKQRIVAEGLEIVEKARNNASRLSAGAIQTQVDKAVRKVRNPHDPRRH